MFGFKKPINQLENPIQPIILGELPRFRWSKKHWTVGPEVIRDTENITQFIDDAVLTQSRDYNKTIYGQSSFAEKVNGGAFRPPPLSYYEDIGPLNRIPVTIDAITPRINPGTAGFDSGTSGFTSQTARDGDVYEHGPDNDRRNKSLTSLVKSAAVRPTFYAPFADTLQHIYPDLEVNMPAISQTSGYVFPEGIAATEPVVMELKDKRKAISVDAGYEIPMYQGISETEQIELKDKRKAISVDAGYDIPMHQGIENREILLEYTNPRVSVDSGRRYPVMVENFVYIDGPQQPNLEHNKPLYSVKIENSAKDITPLDIDNFSLIADNRVEHHRNMPYLSVDAGYTCLYQNIDDNRPVVQEYENKINAPMTVLNVGDSENGYKLFEKVACDEKKYCKTPIHYSYQVKPNSDYREKNEASLKPYHREKLQPEKSYGKVTHASAIPVFGIQENTGLKFKLKK